MVRTYKTTKTTRKRRQRGGAKVETVITITRVQKKRAQKGGAFSKADLENRSSSEMKLPYRMVIKPMPSFRTF